MMHEYLTLTGGGTAHASACFWHGPQPVFDTVSSSVAAIRVGPALGGGLGGRWRLVAAATRSPAASAPDT